jgi:hypothetical protein
MHVRASRCSAERTVAPRLLPRNWCCGSLCFPAKPFAGTVEPTNRRFESPQAVRTKSKHAPPTHSGWRRWCLRLPDRQPPTWVHVTGLTFGLNAAIETGAGVVAPDVEELSQHSVSVLASIPTMLQSPLGRRIMERVNTLVSAGGTPPRPVVRWPHRQYLLPAGDVRPGLRGRTRRGEPCSDVAVKVLDRRGRRASSAIFSSADQVSWRAGGTANATREQPGTDEVCATSAAALNITALSWHFGWRWSRG